MTTYDDREMTCHVCGRTSQQMVLTSTHAFGYPDLDSRQAQPARYANQSRIEVCPECGYCAPQLDCGPAAAKSVVASERYAAQLRSTRYPRLANQWLCAAMIKETAGEYEEAAWGQLYAAWTCDGAGKTAELAGLQCRRRAIARFLKTRSAIVLPTTTPTPAAAEDLILVDLLRRVHCFNRASTFCEKALAAAPPGKLGQLLEFELKLIAQRDATRHCAGEVLETEEERQEQWRVEHPPLKQRITKKVQAIGFVLVLVLVLCVAAILLPVDWLLKKLSKLGT